MGVISAAVGPPQAVTCQPLHEGEGVTWGCPRSLLCYTSLFPCLGAFCKRPGVFVGVSNSSGSFSWFLQLEAS